MFEFICYGGADIYQSVFSSLAMITGSSASSSLIVCMVMAMTDANIGHILKWFFTAFIIYGILWVPKVTVQVTDRLNPAYVTPAVANVPLGVGATASLISRVGDRVIQLTELAFSDPADAKYSKNGVVFGAKLMSKIKDARPTNQIFAANLNYYMTNCAIYDINDQTVKAQDLATTKDTWSVLTANPHPMRMTESLDASGNLNMVSCAALVTIMNTGFDATSDEALASITRSADPSTTAANSLVKGSAVLDSYLSIIGETQQNARRVMRNAITRNGLSDAIAQSGQSGLLASLGEEMAHDQTKKTQGFLGAAGETAIPVLKIVVECLFIGIFPVIFPLFLMPKVGMKSAQMYLVGFFYLQLWGPMYVILHKIMMFYAYQKAFAATVSFGTPAGLNMMTINAVADANSDITALAGSMSLMIPVMAGLVTRGAMAVGAQGEALLGQFRSGAEAAGSMTATGNATLANTNFETSSVMTSSQNLVTANQFSTRAMVAKDGAEVTLATGDRVAYTENGRPIGFQAYGVHNAGGTSYMNAGSQLESRNSREQTAGISRSDDRTYTSGETNAVNGSINWASVLGQSRVQSQGRTNDTGYSRQDSTSELFSQGLSRTVEGRFSQQRDVGGRTGLTFSNQTQGNIGFGSSGPSGGVGGSDGPIGTGAGTPTGPNPSGDLTNRPPNKFMGVPISGKGDFNQSFGLSSNHEDYASNQRGYSFANNSSRNSNFSRNADYNWSLYNKEGGFGSTSVETANRAELTRGTNISHVSSQGVSDSYRLGINSGINQVSGISSSFNFSSGINGNLDTGMFDYYVQKEYNGDYSNPSMMANYAYLQRDPEMLARLKEEYLQSKMGAGLVSGFRDVYPVPDEPKMDFKVNVSPTDVRGLSEAGNSSKVDSALKSGNIRDAVSGSIGQNAYRGANFSLGNAPNAPTTEGNITDEVSQKVDGSRADVSDPVIGQVREARKELKESSQKSQPSLARDLFGIKDKQ